MLFDLLRSVFAVPILLFLVWILLAEKSGRFPLRVVVWGIGIQLFLAVFVLVR